MWPTCEEFGQCRACAAIVQPLAPPHDAIAMSGFGLWNGVDGCEFRSHRGFDGLSAWHTE